MNKTTAVKVAGLTLLAAVAVYTQYKPQKTPPKLEPASEPVVSDVQKAVAGVGVAVKEAGQYAQGLSPQEAVEAREPFELSDKDTPLDVITTLLTAPFGAEPGETLSEKANWRILAYPPEYCEPPAYSKTFRRKGPGMEINLYSYTVPSLTEAKELVLSGDIKIFKPVEQTEVLQLLKNSGFDPKPTEKQLSSPGGRNWSGVLEIQKGALSGLLYFEPHGGGQALKVRLEHETAGKFSYRGPAPRRSLDFKDFAPEFISDLEKHGATKIFGDDWPAVKELLAFSSAPVSLEVLIRARAAALDNSPDGDDAAAFMVLETLLVDRMFPILNSRLWSADKPPEELKLLDEAGIGYELKEYGESYYAPKDNDIFKAYTAHPSAYWGQYAFMREMESGFPAADFYDDMQVVMKKGEEFLAAHPDSPFLPRVLFLLGKANETAYSVGLSPFKYTDLCSHAYCVELEENTEKHRLNAIKYYTQLLSLPGGKEYEEHLKHILPKLKTKGSSYGAFYIKCGGC